MEIPIVEAELYNPLLHEDLESASANVVRRSKPSTVKKWTCCQRMLCFCSTTVVIVLLGVGVLITLMWPVEVSLDYSPENVLLVSGDTVTVRAHVKSWNSLLCSNWKWDAAAAAGSLGNNKQTSFQVAAQPEENDGESNKVRAECTNFIGRTMGSSDIHLNIGYSNPLLVTLNSAADVLQCPTSDDPNSLVLSDSTTASLQPGDIVGSTVCGTGFLYEVTDYQKLSNATSLEDVFTYVDLPTTPIPYTPILINATTAPILINAATAYTESSTTLVDQTNWVLPFTLSGISGSVTFNRLLWEASTDLQSLHYENGKFQSVIWKSSTTVTAQVTVLASLLTEDVFQSTISLFKFDAPPVAFPVPILEIVTVNAEFDVDLELTATVRVPQSYAVEWSLSFVITYEWSVTCGRADNGEGEGKGDLSCALSGVVSQNQLSASPVGYGALDGDVTAASTVSVDFSVVLLLSVGVQLDELVALNDKLTVGMELTLPATWVDVGGALPCPTMNALITDSLAVDLRIFVIDITTLFDYTIYTSGSIPIAVDNADAKCVTASPTLAPVFAPSADTLCPFSYPQPLYILVGSFDTQCGAFGAMGDYAGYLCANGVYSTSPECGASGMSYDWQFPDCMTSTTPNAVVGCGWLTIHTTCDVPGKGVVACDLTTEVANPWCMHYEGSSGDRAVTTSVIGGCGYVYDETDPITPMVGLFYFETQPFVVETHYHSVYGYCYCSNGYCSAGGAC